MIRPGKRAPTHKQPGGTPTPKVPAQIYSFPAPSRGWVLNENRLLAQPAGALVLDNWFPTVYGIKVRGGATRYATMNGPVGSLFTYRSATEERMFAATATAVYDVTNIASATRIHVGGSVGGRTSSDYVTTQFGTAGGAFLYAVNGADEPLLFDGATTTKITGVSVPAITGVDPSTFSYVFSHANRLFFIEKASMSAWYLPVDSIGGAALEISLAGVFTKGGYLLAGTRWSMDAGDGLDDRCVFLSSEGEVAVYQGGNPSSAADWALVGLYDIAKPLGNKALIQAGGDVLIATQAGLVAMSQAVALDVAVLGSEAVSKQIAPYWATKAATLPSGWQVMRLPTSGALYVTQPTDRNVLVVNMKTGAWARYTGWDARAVVAFEDNGYFADNVGGIFLMEDGGSDDGAAYTSRYLGLHQDMGAGPAHKVIGMMRYTLMSSVTLNPALSVAADFAETGIADPASGPDGTVPLWDLTDWDVSYWDGGDPVLQVSNWQAIGKSGFVLAPELKVTFDIQVTPKVELMSIDATFNSGAVIT